MHLTREFRRVTALAVACLTGLMLSPVIPLAAQENTESPSAIRLSGSATLTGDVYDFSSTPSGAEQARRPVNLWRLIFNPVITIGDLVTLPFSIMVSSRETNTVTASVPSPSFIQFLQNPANNIGMLSFTPRIGWAQASLGSHVPQYSELSTGDEQIFGAGLELKPGSFRFAVNGGTSQRAIEPDSLNSVRGAYARHMYSAKIGYGKEDASFADLNIVRAKDDVSSLGTRPAGIDPQEGLVVTANYRIGLSDNTSVTGEIGGSAFTRDLGADIASVSSPVPESVYKHRISTATDYAGTLMFNYSEKAWGFKAGSKYIGAGYFSLAFPYMQPDRLDFLLAPYAKLFENTLSMNGSIGYRTNNLSETKASTSSQLIGSFTAIAMVSENISFNTRYANYGIRNRMQVDTLKIDMVTNSFSLSPSFNIPTTALINTIPLSWSLDAYNEVNTMTQREMTNNTQSYMGMYMASFIEIPLSSTLTVSYMTNDVPDAELELLSASAGLSYRLLENAVRPSLNVTWSQNSMASFTPDEQFLVRVGAEWSITPSLTFTLAATSNSYRYGTSRPDVSFRETFLETSLSMSF
ncbi:MAG: hypothetical protein IPP94_17055 [Ignavibacteria bacterium]|nr:hypothetical protein [Ignavibacteria bacterium]